MRTIGSVLDKHKGIGPGFDFLRIELALSVLFTHSIYIVQGEKGQFSHPPAQLLHESIIPMFFALSGFLITGSAIRLKLRDFILNRCMRIVPALAVDIMISALIIGSVFTTFSLAAYYHSHEFIFYFTNIFGWIHFTLPGVFISNPTSAIVNGSLWTVPFEISCYIIMSLFILCNFLKNKWVSLAITFIIAVCIAIGFANNFLRTDTVHFQGNPFSKIFQYLTLARGVKLYIYFLVGCVFYLFRYEIVYSPVIFILLGAVFLLFVFNCFNFFPTYAQDFLLYPTIVYITIFIGLTKIPPILIYNRGDYSYGIYLYGYPLQQVIIILLPQMKSISTHFAISVFITSLVAMGSWHFIEKPILRLRRKFSFTARKGDHSLSLPTPTVDE